MKFTLLTPASQMAATEDAAQITVAGEAGDFGVLPGHMPMVSTLRPGGQVSVTETSGKTQTFTISAGVAEVSPSGVVILAETAEAL